MTRDEWVVALRPKIEAEAQFYFRQKSMLDKRILDLLQTRFLSY
ncbi:MAG: hypothetical protein RLZZ301_16 [Bacteroidota bacterium]|jgi:hypothetical protein